MIIVFVMFFSPLVIGSIFLTAACLTGADVASLGSFGRGLENNFSRRALETTLTELKLNAAAPNIGFSFQPNIGMKTPAASGMPMLL